MHRSYLYNIAVIMALFIIAMPLGHASTNTSTLSANVSVTCPFSLRFNTGSLYVRGFPAYFNYTAYPLVDCSLPSASGYFQIYNNSNSLIKEKISNISINSTLTIHSIYISNISLSQGKYTARLNLTDVNSNSVTGTFSVLLPPNIIITSIHENPEVFENSLQTIYINFTNTGNLTALNTTLNIDVSGPIKLKLSYNESNISPGSESVSITLPQNATSTAGSYNVTAYLNYSIYGRHYTSQPSVSTYKVVFRSSSSGPSSIPIPTTPSIPTIPYINFTTAPIYLTIQQGGSITASIGLLNNGNLTETFNFSIPKEFANMLSISSTSITLPPHQSLNNNIYLHANSTTPSSIYVVPININITSQSGATSTYKEFLTFDILAQTPNEPGLTGQLYMDNGTKTASGTESITAPSNSPILNATVDTIIPLYATGNISNIYAYGIPNRVVRTSSGYEIEWSINYLPAGQSIYGYYTISDLSSQRLPITETSQSISFYSSQRQRTILDLLNISVPIFYTNSINNITLSLLYTGISPNIVNLSMSGPISGRIENPRISINASPNQVINTNFYIKTGNSTGSMLLFIGISTPGSTLNYSIPVLVMQAPSIPTKPSPHEVVASPAYDIFKGIASYINANIYVVITAIVSISVIALLSKYSIIRRNRRLKRIRAERMIELREHIKRGYKG